MNELTYSQKKKFGSKGSQAILAKTGGKCWYCGIFLKDNARINDPTLGKKKKKNMFTLDHLVSRAKGGSRTDINNLVPCCNNCNNLKASGGIDFLRMQLIFKKQNWPYFTVHQFEFLVEKGIDLHKLEEYVFFFEIQGGLNDSGDN